MEETTTATTDIVIAAPGGVSLGQALHNGVRFASTVRPSNIDDSDARWLSWATGNQEAFAINGKTPLPAARGWFIDQPGEDRYPDDYALVEAMDLLCEQRLAAECIVVRQDKETKAPRKVASWHLPIASLFVVCEGVPSRSEMLADHKERWGVAYSARQNGVKSSLAFYCYVKELLDAGYPGIFHCQFASYLTEPALKLLRSHQNCTLNFAQSLRAKHLINEPLAYYAYALPVRCSTETITARYNGPDASKVGQSKELYYPVPAVPLLSERTPQREADSLEYLANVAITDEQALLLESDGRVERIVEWSINRSQRLTAGEEIDDNSMINLDEPPF